MSRLASNTILKKAMVLVLAWCLYLPGFQPDAFAATPQQLEKADRMRKTAAQLIKEGEYKQAIPKLEYVLRINPKDTNASLMLKVAQQRLVEPFCQEADKAFQNGDYELAINSWKNVQKANPDDIRADMLIDIARSLMHENLLDAMYAQVERFLFEENFKDAVAELEKILTIKPDEERARETLIYARQALTTQTISQLYAVAQEYMDKEQYDAAIDEWEKILEIDPSQENAQRLIASARKLRLNSRYEMARELYENGSYEASLTLYSKLQAENPTDEELKKVIRRLNGTIKVIQKLDGQGKFMDVLRKALKNHIAPEGNPKAAVAAAWYAEQLEPESDLALSIRVFLEREHLTVFRSMEPPIKDMNLIEQYLFASLNHIYEGRYDLAIDEASIVLELDPDNELALKRLGSAFYAIGNKAEARKAWERALELSPDDKELKNFIKLTN